jgi:flagellar hook protein FlgE
MSFETALTGLNAAAADLDVTGNNIANGQTTGFKVSRAEFADIFAASSTGVSRNAIGQGVRLAAVTQQFSQGQFSFTGNNMDLAINGSGFFRMSDGGQVVYTRAGQFQLDRDGYITDSNARRLTGRGVDAAGGIGGALTELRINTGDVAPRATGSLDMTANLQAGASEPAVAFDNTVAMPDPDSYNFSTSTTVYDSLGRSHLMTFYFRKDDSDPVGNPRGWNVFTQIDGDAAGWQGPTAVTFDDQGRIATVNGGAATEATYNFGAGLLGGAAPLDIAVDYANLTQYGTPYSVTQLSQDGYPAGQFSGLSIEPNGIIFARYSNGQSTTLGQVTLAQFPSPQNLQQIGNTSWVETFGSGAPITDAPGNSGLGQLQSGSLEQSNVNVTEQLVKMITAQRAYQANAKMISTQDSITQEILNIR